MFRYQHDRRTFRGDPSLHSHVFQPFDDWEEKIATIRVLQVLDVEQAAYFFTNLCDFTDRNRVQFSFVTFGAKGGFTESMTARSIPVHALESHGHRLLPRAARRLWKILRDEDPDVVHTHLFSPTVIGLSLARWQGRKAMFTRHHSDAVHALSSPAKRGFYLMLERRNNRLADHIVAPSRMVRDCLVERECTPREKVSLIPYGQTSERFDAITPAIVNEKRRELGMDGQVSLVCVSRLYPRKGHEDLFRALAPLVRDRLALKLYLIGTGDYRQTLERRARELGVSDSVVFLGWRDDVLAIIGAADIVVHPSLEDALSQSLIESLALGRPIVATDISGASDTLDGGNYGKLVPPGDPEAFRIALSETIDHLDAARQRARQGRKYLFEYMDARRVANEYTKLYESIVGL